MAAKGIEKLIIGAGVGRSGSRPVKIYQRAATAKGLVCAVEEIAVGEAAPFLHRIVRQKRTGLLFASARIEGLCLTDGKRWLEMVAAERRILFPHASPAADDGAILASADHITIEWPQLAERLARTLTLGPNNPAAFETSMATEGGYVAAQAR